MMKKLLLVIMCLVVTTTFAKAQSNYKHITSTAQFEALLDGSDDPDRMLVGPRAVVLDFCATWCGPCKQFAPIFKAAAARNESWADFYSVDVDQNQELAELFEIKTIPALVIIPVIGEPAIMSAIFDEDELVEAVVTYGESR